MRPLRFLFVARCGCAHFGCCPSHVLQHGIHHLHHIYSAFKRTYGIEKKWAIQTRWVWKLWNIYFGLFWSSSGKKPTQHKIIIQERFSSIKMVVSKHSIKNMYCIKFSPLDIRPHQMSSVLLTTFDSPSDLLPHGCNFGVNIFSLVDWLRL